MTRNLHVYVQNVMKSSQFLLIILKNHKINSTYSKVGS